MPYSPISEIDLFSSGAICIIAAISHRCKKYAWGRCNCCNFTPSGESKKERLFYSFLRHQYLMFRFSFEDMRWLQWWLWYTAPSVPLKNKYKNIVIEISIRRIFTMTVKKYLTQNFWHMIGYYYQCNFRRWFFWSLYRTANKIVRNIASWCMAKYWIFHLHVYIATTHEIQNPRRISEYPMLLLWEPLKNLDVNQIDI